MSKPKPKLLILLDMHAILHRGYHALPDFVTNDGQPTGALFGLYTMLLSIIDELKPDYIVGCYDLPQPTKRHELFADYKAGRKKTDEALLVQIEESRQVLQNFGINYFASPGFEADDLLGTIVHQLQPQLGDGVVKIVIASGDHDTLQLVQGDRVKVYAMRRGIKDTVLYSEAEVVKKYNFVPGLIPDYKGLRGDPSDNIPGIAGIGEKTASTLIQEFGSLDKILEAAANPDTLANIGIRKGIVAKLQSEAMTAKFSKELAMIRTDAPVEFVLADQTWRDQIDTDKLLAGTEKLQFRSLKKRLDKVLNLELGSAAEAQTGSLFASVASDKGNDNETTPEQALKLEQAKLMLWLLNSDQTNPTPADIERFTKQNDLDRAWQYLRDQITAQELDRVFTEIEAPLLPVVAAMNHAGISLDVEFLAGLEANYSKMLNEIEQKIYKLVGHEFNAASPKQLGEILFDELNLPKKGIKKTSTGGFSTAESELEKLRGSHPIIPLILSYRELAKLVNTYISALPKLVDPDGRLRATLVQWGTTTGRMSSRAPNLQNIPIRSELGAPIRRAFRASNNQVLVAIDYSQIELRIAAWLSGDEALKQIFQSGGDIHASVAADMFEVSIEEVTTDMRAAAKTINYGILYGMGANALKANLNQTNSEDITKSQALAYLDKYFEAFPKLAEYQKTIKQEVKKHGFTQTYFGRRRYFATIKSKLPYLRAAAERMAVNAPIQGTQADIIKLAMVAVSKWLDQAGLQDEVTLLLQVHDELVFEVNQEKVDEIVPKLVDIMQGVLSPAETGGVIMKADAKVGPNWGEMKPYEKSK